MQNKLDMQYFVTALLKEKIPLGYRYHNYEHSLYVQENALKIGQQEHCTSEEMKLLSAAALWHDTGFIRTVVGHEMQSCVLAKTHLPTYGFTENEIEIICGMIMATKLPQEPTTKLEEIIADADLVYLASDSATSKATDLFFELQFIDPSLTETAWNQMQFAFLSTHHYFTPYCKKHKEPLKQIYFNQIKKLVK